MSTSATCSHAFILLINFKFLRFFKMYKQLLIVFLFFLISDTSCSKPPASRNTKKDSNNLKITKGLRSRGEIMDNLFVIYDPSFLAIVWPKITNGVHLNIDNQCWDDMNIFLKDLTDGRAWAYRTADSSGRYPSGLLSGNHFWLGSKEQCLALDERYSSLTANDTWGVGFYSRDYLTTLLQRERQLDQSIDEWQSLVERDELLHRVVAADNVPPFHVAYIVLQLQLNITMITLSESLDITLGMCLPRSCSPEEVISIVNFSIMLNDNLKSNKTTARTIRIRTLRQVEAQHDLKNDLGAVLTILITIILGLLALIATVVDLDWVKPRTHPTKAISFDLQKYNNTNVESDKRFIEEFKNVEADKRFIDEFTKTHVSEVMKEAKVYGSKGIQLDEHMMKNLNISNSVNVTNASAPSITLDVVNAEGALGSCARCGKYKKQCSNPKQLDNLGPCPRVKYNSCASLATEYRLKTNFFKNLLLSFSLRHSWKRIFNTTMANKDLAVIHVLRILATFWMIFVHVAMLTNYLAENGGYLSEHNNVYHIITTGTLAFDTLFFVSGLFSAHHFFYLKSHFTVAELVNCSGYCGQALQLVCFISNRAIRLLPPYVLTIFVAAAAARAQRRTATLALPPREHAACDAHWWRNVLYLTTLYPEDQQCMQVSWYLSTETQLHGAGAALCLLLAAARGARGRVVVVALLCAAALAAASCDFVAAYTEYSQRITDVFGMYSMIISRPLARVAPYFIGVLGGWLVHRLEGSRLPLSKVTWWSLWSASALSAAAAMAATSGAGWLAAGAGAHVAWPVALIWPTLVCSTKYSRFSRSLVDSAVVAALSRLSYAALLAHGPAARALLLAADAPLCGYTTCVVWHFLGTTVLTLVAALALALLVEIPCCSLLRRISDVAYS